VGRQIRGKMQQTHVNAGARKVRSFPIVALGNPLRYSLPIVIFEQETNLLPKVIGRHNNEKEDYESSYWPSRNETISRTSSYTLQLTASSSMRNQAPPASALGLGLDKSAV
jgi:hypothetical protein